MQILVNAKNSIWISWRSFLCLFSKLSLLLFLFILNYLLGTFLRLSIRRRRLGLYRFLILFLFLGSLFCNSLSLLILFLFLLCLFLCESCCIFPILSNLNCAHLSQISYSRSVFINCIAVDLDNFWDL